MTKQNPIEQAIAHLVSAGWTEDEAKNLLRAIKDTDGARLFHEVAPKWVDHCYDSMSYVKNMLGVVAMGLVSVTLHEDGEFRFKLNNNGIEAGKQMGLK
jgi:hypothetical protein